MQVVTFAPALRAAQLDTGGIDAHGFPMTCCYAERFPAQLTIPLVVAVYAQGGSDYDPRRYVLAHSPTGERVGSLEFAWHWPDNPGSPVKFRVFAHQLPITAAAAGLYTLGLYDSPDATHTPHLFPLPVVKVNPLTARRPGV